MAAIRAEGQRSYTRPNHYNSTCRSGLMAAIRAEGRRSYTNLIIKIPPVGAASWPRFAPKDSVYARHGYSYSLVQTEIYAATGFILQALQANTPA